LKFLTQARAKGAITPVECGLGDLQVWTLELTEDALKSSVNRIFAWLLQAKPAAENTTGRQLIKGYIGPLNPPVLTSSKGFEHTMLSTSASPEDLADLNQGCLVGAGRCL